MLGRNPLEAGQKFNSVMELPLTRGKSRNPLEAGQKFNIEKKISQITNKCRNPLEAGQKFNPLNFGSLALNRIKSQSP